MEGCASLNGRQSNAHISWKDVLKSDPKARACKACRPDQLVDPAEEVIIRLEAARDILVTVRDSNLPLDVAELVNDAIVDLGMGLYYLRNDSR